MKKAAIIAIVIVLCIMLGVLVIHVNQTETDVTLETTKVGLILNGAIDDGTWGESHYLAMTKVAEELNLELHYLENVPENRTSLQAIDTLVSDGCEIVIADSFGYGDALLAAAEKYPEIYFFHATGVDSVKNLASYFGRMYQVRYLSGIVAGLQTETNEIAYVAAYPIPEVNRGINAFALGVRSVNPEATVHVEWINSWNDSEAALEAYEQLKTACDFDVVTMHTNSLSIYDAAEQDGIWIVGYDLDNRERYPKRYLTGCVWDWETFYYNKILECMQDKFLGKVYWMDMKSGMVQLAPLTDKVKEGAAEAVQEASERLLSGDFDVFYGPIYDNEGNLRVEALENMSDEELLKSFDWYVEGVVVHD